MLSPRAHIAAIVLVATFAAAVPLRKEVATLDERKKTCKKGEKCCFEGVDHDAGSVSRLLALCHETTLMLTFILS